MAADGTPVSWITKIGVWIFVLWSSVELKLGLNITAGYVDVCILFPADDFVPYDNVVTNLFNKTDIS